MQHTSPSFPNFNRYLANLAFLTLPPNSSSLTTPHDNTSRSTHLYISTPTTTSYILPQTFQSSDNTISDYYSHLRPDAAPGLVIDRVSILSPFLQQVLDHPVMDSRASSRIPTRVAINGKSYSPKYIPGSEEASSKFLFSLSHRTDPRSQKASIELRIFAYRAFKKGDTLKTQYQANFLFPNNAIVNYSYTTPSTFSGIDRAFHDFRGKEVGLWRCLNFSAKEVIIETGLGGIPPLYSEQTEINFARLMNTAKNVNAIPDAVLEVSCLIGPHNPDLTDASDLRVADMERALFAAPSSPCTSKPIFEKASPSPSPPQPSSEKAPKTYLTMDTLSSKYKLKHEASQSSSTVSTFRNGDSPAKASFSSDEAKSNIPPSKSRHRKSLSAPHPKNLGNWRAGGGGSSMFQGNSPPKILDANTNKNKEKAVCFNCYAVGHREGGCTAPKKKMGDVIGKMALLKIQDGGKEEVGKEVASPQWFCINCRKRGHTHWLCPEPKAKGV